MYIAVIAKNIANRKQTERLLERAKKALFDNLGTLYIDSFGDEESLLHACMKYDLFLLDYEQDYDRALLIAGKLTEKAAPGVLAICKYQEDSIPELSGELPSFEYKTIEMPLRQQDIHALVLYANNIMSQKRKQVTLIEIRSKTETRYVPKEDIIYARYDETSRLIHYHLINNECLEVIGYKSDIIRSIGDYSEFEFKPLNMIVNSEHIVNETKKSIQLSNGESFEYPLLSRVINNFSRL